MRLLRANELVYWYLFMIKLVSFVVMGKISKPQKSRKHKKMKAIDPFYTGDRPSDRNAYKFDLAPRHGDEQELSRSVREIIQLKTIAKSGNRRQRKRASGSGGEDINTNEKLGVIERGVTRPFKSSPEFKQQRGESQAAFLRRIDEETRAVIQKAKFDDKYHMDSDSEPEQTTEASRNDKKMKRLKRKREKLAEHRRRKKEDKFGDFEQLKDKVQFGEVAMQPPMLTARPKRPAGQNATPQAGTKSKSLLLAKYLDGTMADDSGTTSAKSRSSGGTASKRRRLCLAERVLLDSERQRAIQLYRDLKAARTTPANL
jgi:Txe/YoeB family toxin of Txe-Axe toxin-antitoxin module